MSLDPHLISMIALFAAVGFLAQLVDGALGMAYGVISTTVLLAIGVPPAAASAAVHTAEVATTGASGLSHIAHRNVDWRALALLGPAGVLGGVVGAFLLTGLDAETLRPLITGYLALMGFYILTRAFRPFPQKPIPRRLAAPVGLIGGFLDAMGGGGWGPMVTSTLIGAGGAPRKVIGTVNTAEFFVSASISAAFIAALLTGHWQDAGELIDHAPAVAGLILGGVAAAPLAGFMVKAIKPRVLSGLVGSLILALALFQTVTARS